MSHLLALIAAMLASGLTLTAPEQQSVMDAIEHSVVLPPHAVRLELYARYYAQDQQGNVVGIFVQNADVKPGRPACKELNEQLGSRSTQCITLDWGPDHIKAGERTWLTNAANLPLILDGGCSIVHLVYSRSKKAIEEVRCNGVA